MRIAVVFTFDVIGYRTATSHPCGAPGRACDAGLRETKKR
jgi:hypothetical protein